MSIVRVLRGSTALRSSSVTVTCLPESRSSLRVIAANGTSLSSSEHQRWVSIGDLSFSWSWRKCRSRSRTALTSCTGTLTRPKLSEPVQSERGMVSAPPAARHARLERREQVAGVVGLGALRQRRDLALGLRLDVLEQPLPVGVLELLRVELVLQRLEQLPRHVELALAGVLRRRRDLEVLGRDELVVEAHRVHDDHVVERAERHEVLAVVEDPSADARAARLVERVVEEPV